MAELHIARGDLQSAEPLFKQVLEIYERELGPDHPTTAISLSNLASLYLRRGMRERAEPMLKRALHIEEQALGPEHPQVANTLLDLGLLNAIERKPALAEALVKRALTIQEKTYGTNNPKLVVPLNQLALAYVDQGNYRAAESSLERALALAAGDAVLIRDIAISQRYLAVVYRHEAKFAQAELAYQRAVDVWAKAVAPDDPRLLSVLREYLSLIRRDRKPEVRELQNRIKNIESRTAFMNR